MACEGKLTDPGEGTGARFEKGEGVDLGSDEEDMPEVKKAHDPWAVSYYKMLCLTIQNCNI